MHPFIPSLALMKSTYIALLRGINVSGKNIIRMEDLRRHYAVGGFEGVETYIQSGNVIFRHEALQEDELQGKVEQMQSQALGYHVETFIREPKALGRILEMSPFPAPAGKEEQVYVAFMKENPDAGLATLLESLSDDLDTYRVIGREVYIHSWKNKPGKSKFTPGMLEKKLKQPLTTRNWATVSKLAGWE